MKYLALCCFKKRELWYVQPALDLPPSLRNKTSPIHKIMVPITITKHNLLFTDLPTYPSEEMIPVDLRLFIRIYLKVFLTYHTIDPLKK